MLYITYFPFVYRIDATANTGRLGRLVNDSPTGSKECNAKMKKIVVDHKPHLALFCSHDISAGVELHYDYQVEDAWWRQVKTPDH